jgi:hypothetical protein
MEGGGETSGAPQDHRRISDMQVAAARGRQSVWSCRATRGGHRQGFENAIFTCPRAYSYRAQCVRSHAVHPYLSPFRESRGATAGDQNSPSAASRGRRLGSNARRDTGGRCSRPRMNA